MSAFIKRVAAKVNRRKVLDENVMDTQLERCLTTFDLTLLGVGSMVGSGLFVLTGEVARNIAGPSVSVSYFIAGVAALLAAICYAEFGSRIPKAGSAYVFAYVTIGEIWAFLVGWNILLEYVVGAAATGKAFSSYFDNLIGGYIRNATIETLLGGEPWTSVAFSEYPDFLAALIIMIMVALVSMGASLSTNLNNVCVIMSVSIVTFMFIASMFYVDISNWSVADGYFAYGFDGTLSGAATCFYAYLGFEVIAVSGEEAKTPGKSIPLAMIFAFCIAATAYILSSIGLTLMVPYTDIDPSAAFSAAFDYVGLTWAKYPVGVGALLAILTSTFGNIFPLPRSLYAIASDGLIFKIFSKVNSRTKVPIFGVVLFGLLAALMALFFDLDVLVEFLSIGTLCGFSFVAISVIIVRYSPELCNISIKNPRGRRQARTVKPLTEITNVGASSEYPGTQEQNGEIYETEDLTGQLKEQFERFEFLKSSNPGDTIVYCIAATILFQLTAIFFMVYMIKYLAAGQWWAILIAIVLCSLAILAFLPIPMHHKCETEMDFKVPLVPYLPAVSILLNIVLMSELDSLTWLRFAIWILIGLVIYGVYGYKHSIGNNDVTDGFVQLGEDHPLSTVADKQYSGTEPVIVYGGTEDVHN